MGELLCIIVLQFVEFDFIRIVPLLPSHCCCFFVFGHGAFFFLAGSSILLSMVVQQVVVILVLLQKGMSTCPSTLPHHHLEMEPLLVIFK